MEIHHAINRSTIYFNGPFSMAMLNNQRVNDITIPLRLSWLKGAPCQTTPSKPAAVIAAAVSVGRLHDSPQESFRTMKSWPTLNVQNIAKYLSNWSQNQDFHISFPLPLPFGKVCQTETRTGARESWGPLASGGIALDRQFSLIFSTKRPSGVWEIQKKWRFLAVTNHRTKWVSFSMVMLDYWRVAKI